MGVAAGHSFDDVLDAARRREEWALSALFRAYHAPLLRFLRALERSAADDLAAEVWVGVTQRLTTFRGDEEAFRAWLFRIARNRVADHRRRAARRRTDPVAPQTLVDHLAADDAATVAIEHLAAQEAIDHLIATLPADQAEIVLLRVVAGLSADEVADITGRSSGAVRIIQHRALKRLAVRFPPRVVTR
jgi:RNA polymerase sigma-70 factor, ECF subfamily